MLKFNQDYDITPVEDQGTTRIPLQKMELSTAEHPWVRPSKMEGGLSEEERETERLLCKLQGILNKLTPQKFQILAEQALVLKINSQQKLDGCADRIIAHVVKGSKYSVAYANLCKVMSTIKVEYTAEDGHPRIYIFRRILLTKVQREFEKTKEDDEEREGLLRAIEATQDPERKQQLRDMVNDWDAKNLKRSLGIVHFIGELYKLKMLPDIVIHECLIRLLQSSSDTDSLECFTRLVTISGKEIDKPVAKTRMDQHFSRISEIIKKGKIPLRIKFLLQDVQELRANKWIPRRRHQDYSLKTIDQIHTEARIEEAKEKQLVAQTVTGSTKCGSGWDRTSRQGYLRSSDWHHGREGISRKREVLPPKDKLQDSRKPPVAVKHDDLPVHVELHRAMNPWMRPRKIEEDLSGEKVLFCKLQGILNKVTPQKFQILAERALSLKINSEPRLRGCIDKIFNVALKDSKYGIVYANLCKVMSTVKVTVEARTGDGKPKIITFRRVLLTKVQQEFESKESAKEIRSMLNAVKETHDPTKKRQLEQELELYEAKNHIQSVNNIRFLGELFRLKMLSETIMHECIVRLLRSSSDEHSLEICAVAMTITGKDLDRPEAKTRMDQYFTRISEIVKKGKIPLKIKFMLQDVQDLRANDWIPHQGHEDSLKTIDQIHHEAKVEEEKRKQLHAQAHNGTHSDTASSGAMTNCSDGDKKEKLDARKLQVLLKQRYSSNIGHSQPLGPSITTFRPVGLGQRTKPIEKLDARKLQVLLKRREYKESFQDHNTFIFGRDEKQPARVTQAELSTTNQQLQSASGGKYTEGQQEMDELLAFRLKTMIIADKLIEDGDLEAAASAINVHEMRCSDETISMVINHCLEKSRKHRQSYGQIFSESIKQQLISKEQLISSLNQLLEVADDIVIDVPNLWDYLAEFLSPIVYQCTLPLSFLSSVPASLLNSGKVGLLAVKILEQCSKHLSNDDEVATILWARSSLEWSSLGVSPEVLPKLLRRHNLEYLQETHEPQQADNERHLRRVTELTHLFSSPAISNDDIINWIESHYSPPVVSTPDFVTAMTTALVNACMPDSGARPHFRKQWFFQRVTCLEQYVESDEGLQMRLLFALQLAVERLNLKHPPDILNFIFSDIYDLEIVRREVFIKWRDSGNEASVKSFFDCHGLW